MEFFPVQKVFIYGFRLSCVCLFIVEVIFMYEEYLEEKTGTLISQASQDQFPKPQFCLATQMLDFKNFSKEGRDVKISYEDYYKTGKWADSSLDFTAVETFDKINPEFSEIISTLIIDFQRKYSKGNGYSSERISSTNSTALNQFGIEITRCDYYWYLKCYCLVFEQEKVIQRVRLISKSEVDYVMMVVQPERIFDYSRKFSEITHKPKFTYSYNLRYKITDIILCTYNSSLKDMKYLNM